MRKKRYLLVFILSFFIQNSILSRYSFFGSQINILLPLVCCTAFYFGERAGGNAGLILGLFMDINYGGVMGINALVLFLIGYFIGINKDFYGRDNFQLSAIIMFLVTFINFLFKNVLEMVFLSGASFAYLKGPCFVEALLNIVFLWIYWQIFKRFLVDWRLRY